MSRLGDVIVDAGVVLEVLFDGRQALLPPRLTQEPIVPFWRTRAAHPSEAGRRYAERKRRAERERRRRKRMA